MGWESSEGLPDQLVGALDRGGVLRVPEVAVGEHVLALAHRPPPRRGCVGEDPVEGLVHVGPYLGPPPVDRGGLSRDSPVASDKLPDEGMVSPVVAAMDSPSARADGALDAALHCACAFSSSLRWGW